MKYLYIPFLFARVFAAVGSNNHTALNPLQNTNSPWYPSMDAFEHYDSGRSHLFEQAFFAGSYSGNNEIITTLASTLYPSVYNMTCLNPNQVYAYGGGYGNEPNSIGSYVAQINPFSLETIWKTQLSNWEETGDWDYPGVMGILKDGFLYVIYGFQFSKLDAVSGKIVATVNLPSSVALTDTAYNGFDLTSDGYIVAKSIARTSGCTLQGTEAAAQCPDFMNPSVMVSIDPKTMEVVDQVTLPAAIFGRLTIGQYNGIDYVYLFSTRSIIRYSVIGGIITLDSSWDTGNILASTQTPGSACVIINNWVLAQCNGAFSPIPLSLFAVPQSDSSIVFSIQPFADDPIPTYITDVFPGDKSWIPSAVSADPVSNVVYMMDSFPGKMAAVQVSDSGLEVIWTVDQRTTEFIALIGTEGNRVVVGTDIPFGQVPGFNTTDFVVWRNAATGEEIARTVELPAMTSGSMVQPTYNGDMFYEGMEGSFYKLAPTLRKN